MKRLVLNKKQLLEVATNYNEKPIKNVKIDSPAELQNAINTICNNSDSEDFNNQITVGNPERVNLPATYTVDQNTDISNIGKDSIVNVQPVQESYSKSDVELMRIIEMKNKGIALTKSDLNRYLNS